MSKLWETLNEINAELKKDFLCVPPYQCINGIYLHEVKKIIDEGKDPSLKIRGSINLPWQRAYQMEYRFKRCAIFESFLPAIEYGTYDAMIGNWIGAYLTLLPAVEAVLRKWGEEDPNFNFEQMKGIAPALIERLRTYDFFDDDRVN